MLLLLLGFAVTEIVRIINANHVKFLWPWTVGIGVVLLAIVIVIEIWWFEYRLNSGRRKRTIQVSFLLYTRG